MPDFDLNGGDQMTDECSPIYQKIDLSSTKSMSEDLNLTSDDLDDEVTTNVPDEFNDPRVGEDGIDRREMPKVCSCCGDVTRIHFTHKNNYSPQRSQRSQRREGRERRFGER
jgi:hypothetical protein